MVRLAAMSGFAAVDAPAPGCGVERSSDVTVPVRELRLPSPVLRRACVVCPASKRPVIAASGT